jgi:hypothetical protein
MLLKVGGELGLSTKYGTSVSWELPRASDELRKSGSGYGDAGKGTRICERDDDLGGLRFSRLTGSEYACFSFICQEGHKKKKKLS